MDKQIIRLVKMTFDPGRVDDFLSIFDASSPQIRAQEGCLRLELLTDLRHANVMMTYSIWASEAALESYRKSDLFKETWARTRTLFAARPEATSFRRLERVPSDREAR